MKVNDGQSETQRTSTDIIVIDSLHPEEGAMSQALYSRQPSSILMLLMKVFKNGANKFMALFYSGYGHNSIGDCGTTTLYCENVSMIAAKAIQASPLYNGQEASTRYLDFKGRMMINPLLGYPKTCFAYVSKEMLDNKIIPDESTLFKSGITISANKEGGNLATRIQERWMKFYEDHMSKVKTYVAELNPKQDAQSQEQYDKAINARAFDIMRAFIPAGMTTLVSWHSPIRHLRDRLNTMKYNPNDEVARFAYSSLHCLQEAYPSSFIQKEYPETEEYLKLKSKKVSYFNPTWTKDDDFLIDDFNLDKKDILNYSELLINRPAKTELPHEIGECGTVRVQFKIDFGSFRDVQRHRKGVCKMPLLTTVHGFHQWYLDRLPKESRSEALSLIEELTPIINELPCSDIDRQYYIPMGFIVIADFTWTFDQCVYVAELRSSETVHATLRVQAQRIARWIKDFAPGTALHVNYEDDSWSYKRGSQDIIEKS